MSKPSLRLQFTKLLVFYHVLLWQLGHWPQSKLHCRADVARLPEDEVSALRDFMSNTELRPEQIIEETYCSDVVWTYDFVIECNCTNESECRITGIRMSYLGLSGTIHESVGNLTSLTYLILSNNTLHGRIPDTIGNLKNLQVLDLSRNQLNGSIPASLGRLVSLEYLYLQYNLLSQGIPQGFGSLTKLTELNLQFNMLSGSIPKDFGNLLRLKIMDLSENQLSGRLPESLRELKYLTTFYVSANYLSGEFPKGYDNLISLKKFSIAGNYISGPLPVETIAKWTNITHLVLVGNNFEGNLTEKIFRLQKLQYLLISDLANDGFQLPPNISNSANFISLTLRNCSITGPIPKYIGEEMTSLRYLDLSFNKLTGGLPQYMNSNMIYMSFSRNMLNGTIASSKLGNSQTMTDLSFNYFSAEGSPLQRNQQLNLFACCGNSSTTAPDLSYTMDPFEMKNRYCPENEPEYHSLFINCGGEETTVNGHKYDQDDDTSLFYTSPKKNWAYSLFGDFDVSESNTNNYIKSMTCGVPISEAPLCEKARFSPISLEYYVFCLRKGNYIVTLYFKEIVYIKDEDYSSLRKRVFDVYIQDVRRLNYFNIREEEGTTEGPITKKISAVVVNDSGLLNIHLYWPGKGSYQYQPSLLAISVTPELNNSPVPLITIASIVAALLLLLAFAWRMGWLSSKELPKIKIGQEKIGDNHQDKFVTVKELIDATGNFSNKKKLGCSKTFFMAKLQGHTVAVKRLDSAHFKEKIDKLKKEIGIIESLQHNNILKLLDVYIGKDLQFLVYEYMENQSLEDILFVPSNLKLSSLKLEWETRFNICLGIAQGLQYLHEHERVQIVHTNIKSANILLNEKLEAKISNFGFANLYTEEDKVKAIARETKKGYMAPEYLQMDDLESKVDVFSFGVVVLEIVSGERNVRNQLKKETEVLLDRAYQANRKGNLKSLVDKSLSAYDQREALTILRLAVECTSMGTSVRPPMSGVVSVLLGKKSIDEVCPPAKPTGDVNVVGSTTSGKLTSVASTSSHST
ncbi:hypothetical protein TB1_005363 [Malus domestica]